MSQDDLHNHQKLQDFLTEEKIPKVPHFSGGTAQQHIKDLDGFKTVLRNLISEHLYVRGLYDATIRLRSQRLLDEIKAYLSENDQAGTNSVSCRIQAKLN